MFRRSISCFVQSHARNGMSRSFSSFNNKIDLPIPIQDFYQTQQDRNRITRLSGYFEALRSKKNFNKGEKTCSDKSSGEDTDVFPKVVPFPVPTCLLDDLIRLHAHQNNSAPKNVDQMGLSKNVDLILDLMRDLVHKIGKYHLSGAILLDLKPENIIVTEEKCRIESFDDEDCDAWGAPEQLIFKRQTKASNMFTYGCILYYCLTGGHHPFGYTLDQRILNIQANKMDISRVNDDAYNLISLLLRPEPELRPTATGVLNHPFFWNLKLKVRFLFQTVSAKDLYRDFGTEIESKVPIFKNPDWCKKVTDYSGGKLTYKDILEDDVFGPQGSPNFLPSVLMKSYEISKKFATDEDEWFDYYNFHDGHLKFIDGIDYRC